MKIVFYVTCDEKYVCERKEMLQKFKSIVRNELKVKFINYKINAGNSQFL